MLQVLTFTLLPLLLNAAGNGTGVAGRTQPDGTMLGTCQALKEDAQSIRREGYTAINKADEIRKQAYKVKDDAYDLKEEAYRIKESSFEARIELESTLVEALSIMKSQVTASNLYIQDIKNTMRSMADRLDRFEGVIEEMDSKIVELQNKVEEGTHSVEKKVGEMKSLVEKVGERQQAWISEIRLISLYKITEQNNRHTDGHDSDIAVDGQFLFGTRTHTNMRTYYHSAGSTANNKLWIELGGTFRINKIKIWNTRDVCCMGRLVGSHIYADDKLIGVVIDTRYSYDFTVSAEDPVYATRVTLQQPLIQYLHILELQVWGSGPYLQDDISN